MKKTRVPIVWMFTLAILSSPSSGWDGIDHQLLYPASLRLASSDGGKDFAVAEAILTRPENEAVMMRAVIAPDNDIELGWPSIYRGRICPPLFPSLYHGHDATRHLGFSGLTGDDSELLAAPYFWRASQKWQNGDVPGALYDLGCGLHLVQDASVCLHSNTLDATNLFKAHSRFENWVSSVTASNQHPRSFEELHQESWLVETGGVYLREPFTDESGRSHWGGGLEGWIDVAAHLSEDLLRASKKMDPQDPAFRGG